MLAYDFGTNNYDNHDIVSALINTAKKVVKIQIKIDSGGSNYSRLNQIKKNAISKLQNENLNNISIKLFALTYQFHNKLIMIEINLHSQVHSTLKLF